MFYIKLAITALMALIGLSLIGSWQIIVGIALVIIADKLAGIVIRSRR